MAKGRGYEEGLGQVWSLLQSREEGSSWWVIASEMVRPPLSSREMEFGFERLSAYTTGVVVT